MATTPTTSRTINAAQAWTAATVDPLPEWSFRLPAEFTEALESALGGEDAPAAPTDRLLADGVRSRMRKALRPVRDELEQGQGFVLVEGLLDGPRAAADPTAAYWLLGLALGEPFPQNVQGTLLYSVRDTGANVAEGARFSVTNAESSFHTDNSFGDEVLDYVGLLCLATAKSGGESQLVSGYAAYQCLEEEYPEALEILSRPFHVDRRGGVREGEALTALRPILEWHGNELLVRYLRYWIEAGHEKVGEPLSRAQVDAMDTLDAVLQRPELRVQFHMEPGQTQLVNNRWLFHNRTAFEDWPELERRRHYVRLWVKKVE